VKITQKSPTKTPEDPKYLGSALASTGVFFLASAVSADVVINDGMQVVSYQGYPSTDHFGSSDKGDVIDTNFDASKVQSQSRATPSR